MGRYKAVGSVTRPQFAGVFAQSLAGQNGGLLRRKLTGVDPGRGRGYQNTLVLATLSTAHQTVMFVLRLWLLIAHIHMYMYRRTSFNCEN